MYWSAVFTASAIFVYSLMSVYVSLEFDIYTESASSIPYQEEEVKNDRGSAISIALVGDIMMDRGIRSVVNIHGAGDYSYTTKYLDFLDQYDTVFGNLEGPISDRGHDLGGLYSFRMDPSALTALLDSNFSFLSVANNHAGDWGGEAFEDTVDRLRTAGIGTVGGGMSFDDATEVKVFEADGHSIGFLGFSDFGPEWLEAGDDSAGVLLAGSDYHDSAIERASKEVDTLIVSYHFGEEYIPEPNERQRYLARKAIDLGADIVAGHHPHVIQPVEEYNGGIIAYSLGNFIFDQYFSDETMEGLVLVIRIENGELRYEELYVDITEHFQPRLRE